VYFRDILTSAMIVVAIGTILFGISGVWPPMVAIESGSMEPNMHEGDLVFIVDNERFVPQEATEVDGVSTGIVPADVAEQHGETAYNGYGDVIIFHPNGNTGRTPIIHRAMFWVDEGENWYDRADPAAVGGADSCEQLRHCPAPNAGFITKGDWNSKYDQATRRSAPVQPGWIIGTAELRVPYLGHVRLLFNGVTVTPDITAAATPEMEYSTEPIGKNSDTADVTAMSPASANRLPA
jgi:signal peptidase